MTTRHRAAGCRVIVVAALLFWAGRAHGTGGAASSASDAAAGTGAGTGTAAAGVAVG